MNKHLLIQLTFLFLLLHAMGTTAQKNLWSLQDCIDHALENNLDVRLQRLEAEKAGHDVTRSYSMVLPSLNASTNAGVSFGRSIDHVTNEFFTERIASQRMSTTGSVYLFAGFQTINNIRYNLARHTAMRHDTERMEHDLILTIANAFLQIMYLEDMLEVREEQLDISRQQVERTRVLFEGGTVSRGDMLEMEAIAAEEEVHYTSIKNQLNLAYIELIYLLELDPDKEFRIKRPELTVEELALFHDPESIVEKALGVEPAITAAQQRIAMAENGLAISRGQRLPVLSLHTTVGTAYSEAFQRVANNSQASDMAASLRRSPVPDHLQLANTPVLETIPYRDQISENLSRSIQLSLHIPIFNHLQTRRNIQHAQIDLNQARIYYERTKNDLSKIIHQAHADALAAYQVYVSNTKALDAARESFQFSDQGFGLGLVSTLEYNEAKARLNRAGVAALQSSYEFIFKVKILEFYQGEGFVL